MIAWLKSLLHRLFTFFRFGRAASAADDLDPELREAFLSELTEVQASIQRAFASWRVNPGDQAALKQLRRNFHTIKGSAPIVGAPALGSFCADLERLTILLHDQPTRITPETHRVLEQAVALLPIFADSVRTSKPAPAQASAISQRVQRLAG